MSLECASVELSDLSGYFNRRISNEPVELIVMLLEQIILSLSLRVDVWDPDRFQEFKEQQQKNPIVIQLISFYRRREKDPGREISRGESRSDSDQSRYPK